MCWALVWVCEVDLQMVVQHMTHTQLHQAKVATQHCCLMCWALVWACGVDLQMVVVPGPSGIQHTKLHSNSAEEPCGEAAEHEALVEAEDPGQQQAHSLGLEHGMGGCNNCSWRWQVQVHTCAAFMQPRSLPVLSPKMGARHQPRLKTSTTRATRVQHTMVMVVGGNGSSGLWCN